MYQQPQIAFEADRYTLADASQGQGFSTLGSI
jgi:hypothetical protein